MNTTWRQCTIGDVCDTISNTYNSNAQQVVLINTSDVLEGKVLNHITTVQRNYPIGSVDLNRNHSSDVLV